MRMREFPRTSLIKAHTIHDRGDEVSMDHIWLQALSAFLHN